MDQDERSEPGEEPPCATCGGVRKFLAKLPAEVDLPEVSVFECADCGIVDYQRGKTRT